MKFRCVYGILGKPQLDYWRTVTADDLAEAWRKAGMMTRKGFTLKRVIAESFFLNRGVDPTPPLRPAPITLENMPPVCPKCGAVSGDDWSQCEGDCPMPISPHFAAKRGGD